MGVQHESRGWAVLAACALIFVGCASAPPPKPVAAYMQSSELAPPQFPRARYVSAVGQSQVSGEEAEARARAGVAQQVSASIQVEVDQWASATSGSNGSGDASRYLEKVKLRSDFAHAELVRVAERAQKDGNFYALAVLDRAEGEAALARDVSADEQRFASAADRALAARHAHNAGEFSVAATEAQAALPPVASSYVVRHALLRSKSSAEGEYLSRRDALISALAEARSRRVVDVRIEGSAANPTLLQRAVAAIQRLGLRVAEGKGCGDADPGAASAQDATELVLTPEESCGDGSFGPKCVVSVRLHARGCAGGGEGEGSIAKFTGAHVSDPERARLKAWDKVTAQLVDVAVREALKGTLSGEAQ